MLGVGSLLWQGFTYRESFAERVVVHVIALHVANKDQDETAAAKMGDIILEVVNVGQRPLYLGQVSLIHPCTGDPIAVWPFYGSQKPNTSSVKLDPGASATFRQSDWNFVQRPLGADYCVVVESTRGEILRQPAEIVYDLHGTLGQQGPRRGAGSRRRARIAPHQAQPGDGKH